MVLQVEIFLSLSYLCIMSQNSNSCRSLPVCRLGGDECAQRCKCCVDRIGAISLPRVGRGPLAIFLRWRWVWGDQSRGHGPYIYPSASSPAQLPLPVHLDVKGRWGRRGQAKGGVGGIAGTLLGAWALAAVVVIVFGEKGDVAVQEAARGGCRAQHGECHLGRNSVTVTGQSCGSFLKARQSWWSLLAEAGWCWRLLKVSTRAISPKTSLLHKIN